MLRLAYAFFVNRLYMERGSFLLFFITLHVDTLV